MDHRVGAVDGGAHLVEVPEIGGDEGLPFPHVVHGTDVGQAQPVAPLEILAQSGADEPGRAGDEYFLHVAVLLW